MEKSEKRNIFEAKFSYKIKLLSEDLIRRKPAQKETQSNNLKQSAATNFDHKEIA